MRKIIAKTIKLSFAFAILSATLLSCSEDVLNPDDSATPNKKEIGQVELD
ncbi:MAG: hypothetical protein ACFB15_30600 [Cyclobacteriaceae bacterium]